MVSKYFLIIALCAWAASAQKPCCQGRNVLYAKRCLDGSNITGITCERRYLLDPETTGNFTVFADGSMLDEDTLVSEPFCLTKLKEHGPEVALVCFSESAPVAESGVMLLIRASCAVISVICLATTIIVYALVRSLRDLQGRCLLNSIVALMFSMLLLAILQFEVDIPQTPCKVLGHMVFALFLTSFTWLNVIAFHIWRTTVIPSALGTNKQWYLMYCLYGYGIPAIIIITAITAHHVSGSHIKPGIGEHSCWFSSRKATWAYFYGPIAFLLVLNIVFFIWTVKKLWSGMKANNESPKVKSMKYKCLLYIKLFFIMGLSWTFEVLSFAFQNQQNFIDYIWLVMDFVNALQGVLIFLILVVFRKRALRGLAKRGLGFIRLPQKWKTLDDEECDEEAEEERLAKDEAPAQMIKTKENQYV